MTIYDKHEAVAVLKVSLPTLDRLIASGEISYSKLGKSVRFQERDLQAYLDRCHVPANAELEAQANATAFKRRA